MCGLSLCCEKSANLTREEIKKVAQYYMTTDGRVKYKKFCDMIENSKTTSAVLLSVIYD